MLENWRTGGQMEYFHDNLESEGLIIQNKINGNNSFIYNL